MSSQRNYRNLLEVIMDGEKEFQELEEYITTILPEKSSDKEYIQKISCKVCEIHDAVDLELDKYWIAENYISMLREVKAF